MTQFKSLDQAPAIHRDDEAKRMILVNAVQPFSWSSGARQRPIRNTKITGDPRMARQGCPLNESEIRRIVCLLESTDMTLLNIAERTGRSHAAVAAVNRRFQIRAYGGRRSSWVVVTAQAAELTLDHRTECQP